MSNSEIGAETVTETVEWKGRPDIAPLKLLTTAQVHFDPDNSNLFFSSAENIWKAILKLRAKSSSSSSSADTVRILDLGGGCGVWGLILGRLAPAGITMEIVFSDCDPQAEKLALSNAKTNLPSTKSTCVTGDMFASIEGKFDLILFNPPQSGGSAEFGQVRPDKWGGFDGSMYYVRLARECSPYLLQNTVIAVDHIGFANPTRVRYSLESAGAKAHSMSIAGSQQRTFDRATLDGILPGLFDHQLRNRAASKAEFTIDGEHNVEFKEGDPRAQSGSMTQEVLLFTPISSEDRFLSFSM